MRRCLLSLPIAATLLAQPLAAQTVEAAPTARTADASQPEVDAVVVRPLLAGHVLTESELARETGKFILPSGVELALTITSDTVLNGLPVLRTVLSVDHGSTLTVFGRAAGATATVSSGDMTTQRTADPTAPTGIAVAFDRHSGIQTITPTFTASPSAGVTVGTASAAAASTPAGLEPLAISAGGPAVQTPDGLVSVQTLANGSLVTLTGDQLQASHLVGQSVATALINSGNNRTFDTVTNVAVDLRNVAPYQLGAAAMRADTLALEATRGMLR